LRHRGLAAGELTVIPPAGLVEAGPRSSTRTSQLSLRESLGLPSSARILLCAGRLVRDAGFREAIWAFDILHLIQPEIRLLMAGDGPYRAALEQFVHAIGAQDHVRFLGWRNDLADLFELAELVWCPSLRDQAPLVLLEALAAGRPVVASRQSSVEELTGQSGGVLFCPPADPPALAQQTRRLLEDPVLARHIAQAGQQLVHRRFTLDRWIDRHLELYHRAG
jgi:glycosyltransferase involved in cell wall biosynthesis